MFLRETRRTNRDGSVVSYLQLAHNERHPVSGNPVAKVIHSFGRADQVDRAALARLVSSISRFPTPRTGRVRNGRTPGGGRGAGLAAPGRGMDAGPDLGTPRCRRGDPPGRRRPSHRRRRDRAGGVRTRRATSVRTGLETGRDRLGRRAGRDPELPGFTEDAAYAAMDFLLDALGGITAEVFSSVAHLLNLDLDIVFVDATSTYSKHETADEC